jgi:hypothetical protein
VTTTRQTGTEDLGHSSGSPPDDHEECSHGLDPTSARLGGQFAADALATASGRPNNRLASSSRYEGGCEPVLVCELEIW